MVLKIRLISCLAILAAACLFLIAIAVLSQLGSAFVGLALIAVLAGGIALTYGLSWGLAAFTAPDNSSLGAAG